MKINIDQQINNLKHRQILLNTVDLIHLQITKSNFYLFEVQNTLIKYIQKFEQEFEKNIKISFDISNSEKLELKISINDYKYIIVYKFDSKEFEIEILKELKPNYIIEQYIIEEAQNRIMVVLTKRTDINHYYISYEVLVESIWKYSAGSLGTSSETEAEARNLVEKYYHNWKNIFYIDDNQQVIRK